MSKIIGLVQTKGGVGKTTTALNLSAALRRRGYAVTVLDADPAGHAVLIANDGRLTFGVEAHLVEDVDEASVATWVRQVRSHPADVVVVDAPGTMGLAFQATVMVADIVLVPTGPTVLDLRGAAATVGIIRRHRTAGGHDKPDIVIVPTRIDKRTGAGRHALTTMAALTEAVAPAISYRAIVADSLAAGESVPDDSPSALEFDALADAILVRLGMI